jgi:beta-lactamase regulating signal transducer with metallopeptidase domain
VIERGVVATAWALVLLLVQGGAVAAASALALHVLREASAGVQCHVLTFALALIPLMFGVTWLMLFMTDTTTAANASMLNVGTAAVVTARTLPGALATAAWAIVLVWLAATSVLVMRLLLSLRVTAGLRRDDVRPVTPWLQSVCDDVARNIGVLRPLLRCSASVEVPTVIGVTRPLLLLPAGLDASVTPAELRLLVAHELAHVRRRDCAINLAQTLIESVFFQPGARWLSSRLRAEREIACDEAAVRAIGGPLVLARALERLELLRAPLPLSLAANSGSLLHRIVRLLATRREPTRTRRGLALLLNPVCATALVLAPGCLLPRDVVGATLRAAAPAARMSQTISAYDAAGEFTLSLVALRAVEATIAGRPVAPHHIIQRRDSVYLRDGDGATVLRLHVQPAGGITWEGRIAPSAALP